MYKACPYRVWVHADKARIRGAGCKRSVCDVIIESNLLAWCISCFMFQNTI